MEDKKYVVLKKPEYGSLAFDFINKYDGFGLELEKYLASRSINGYVPKNAFFDFFYSNYNSHSDEAHEHRKVLERLALEFADGFFQKTEIDVDELYQKNIEAAALLTTLSNLYSYTKEKLGMLQITGEANHVQAFFELFSLIGKTLQENKGDE